MLKRKTPIYKYVLGLAVALLLPLSFWVFVKGCAKDQIQMPAYHIPVGIDTTWEDGQAYVDTIYHQVGDFRGENTFGEPFSINEDLPGKILLVNFFFTSCPTICPPLMGNMRMIQEAFKKNDSVIHLVSITVDPVRDSSARLREYAQALSADLDHWTFLTGDRKEISHFARRELFLSSGPGTGGAEDMIHSQTLVLIDRERFIRGYYDGLDTVDLRRCADDMVLLSLEKKRRRSTPIP